MVEGKKQKIEEKKEEIKKIVETPKEPVKEETKPEETKKVEEKKEVSEKTEESKEEEKKEEKPVQTKPKIKKTKAVVDSNNLPISTKYSIAICKFIKGKKIEKAIEDLNQVVLKKKAVPMKGEIPHRKGRIMSGRFPKKASEHFIKLLKSLSGNANFNEIEQPIIIEAIANIGSRPYGRFGRIRRKRTHVKIVAKNIQKKKMEVKK